MSKEEEEATPDVEIEITNGKKIKIDFSAVEWIIIMTGASVIAMITGVAL